jgi:hypothetical protein
MPLRKEGPPQHRLHDLLLVATAQIHGHGLLTKRDAVFGPWTEIEVEVVSAFRPTDRPLRRQRSAAGFDRRSQRRSAA